MYKYLVTDYDEILYFASTKEEAEKVALDKAFECDVITIYEIKEIGIAYEPDPTTIIEWKNEQQN